MALKRPYGTGYLKQRGTGWLIRWRETEIAPDGSKRRVLRFEILGTMPKKAATGILAQRISATGNGKSPVRSLVAFETVANQWICNVLPIYKCSTQKNHKHICEKHLIPRFGNMALSEISRQDIQVYVSHLVQAGYAPKTVDHIHDVLSAILRTAISWGHLHENPARGVSLPKLKTVRPKWALSMEQASALLSMLPLKIKAIVGLAMLTGLRRGELFASRWKDLDETERCLKVDQAVYEGTFGSPKSEAGTRIMPLPEMAFDLLRQWKLATKRADADSLIFSTRSGKPISSGNILKQFVNPACDSIGVPHATWLTFRRTYSTWCHDQGVPGKVLAELMGHAKVDTTLNIYTQTMKGALRTAADMVGNKLFTIVHSLEGGSLLTH